MLLALLRRAVWYRRAQIVPPDYLRIDRVAARTGVPVAMVREWYSALWTGEPREGAPWHPMYEGAPWHPMYYDCRR